MWGTDDRGYRVRVIPVYTLFGLGASWCPLPRMVRKSALADSLRRIPSSGLGAFVACVFFLVVGIELLMLFAAMIAGDHWVLRVARLVLIVGGMAGLIRFAAQRGCNCVAECIVRQGHCATCGHLLDGLPRDHIQRVTCPECGSAWRLGAPFGRRP